MRTIEDLRKAKDILQIEMAKTLDIPVSTYNMYENGKRKVPSEIAYKIAKSREVEVEEIFLPASFTIRKIR